MSVVNVLDAVLGHPASLGVLTGLVGILTFAYQARRKHAAEQSERQRLLYESLIEHVFQLLSAKPGKDRSAVITAIEKSWLFASDEVLRACYKVLDVYIDEGSHDYDLAESMRIDTKARRQFGNAVAELFIAMRTDLHGAKSRIDEEWAREVVHVYPSGAPSEPRQVSS